MFDDVIGGSCSGVKRLSRHKPNPSQVMERRKQKQNKKHTRYNIPHCTDLFFSFASVLLPISCILRGSDFPLFFLFGFRRLFFLARRSVQRTEQQRSATTIDRAYYNHLNERGQKEDGTR